MSDSDDETTVAESESGSGSGRDPLIKVLKKINKELRRRRIDTKQIVDKTTWDGLGTDLKDLINKSNLIDTAWNEIIKAKAIVNPSEYIADRAEMIRNVNTNIVKEADTLYKTLKAEKNPLPENTIKTLVGRKLISSAGDYYAEVNMKYPINNLATSLQNAINSTKLAPGEGETSKSRKRRKK